MFFHLRLHFFQSCSLSVPLFFSIPPSLTLYSFPLLLPLLPLPPLSQSHSVYTSIHIFCITHLFQNPSIIFSIPALPLLYSTPSPCSFFLVYHPLSIIHSLHVSSPFFSNTLLSHYPSPSIVVVVDFMIRAETMSFRSTHFNAQHDYTKPLSTLSFSLPKTLTLTRTHEHKHGFFKYSHD